MIRLNYVCNKIEHMYIPNNFKNSYFTSELHKNMCACLTFIKRQSIRDL